eukprot:Gb_10019 [translate_table: standard]
MEKYCLPWKGHGVDSALHEDNSPQFPVAFPFCLWHWDVCASTSTVTMRKPALLKVLLKCSVAHNTSLLLRSLFMWMMIRQDFARRAKRLALAWSEGFVVGMVVTLDLSKLVFRVEERYSKLREEMKQRDREDKQLLKQRLREKRTKEKLKIRKPPEEVEGDYSSDASGSQSEGGIVYKDTKKLNKVYFKSDSSDDNGSDDSDAENTRKGKKAANIKSASLSIAEQEALALKLLSSKEELDTITSVEAMELGDCVTVGATFRADSGCDAVIFIVAVVGFIAGFVAREEDIFAGKLVVVSVDASVKATKPLEDSLGLASKYCLVPCFLSLLQPLAVECGCNLCLNLCPLSTIDLLQVASHGPPSIQPDLAGLDLYNIIPSAHGQAMRAYLINHVLVFQRSLVLMNLLAFPAARVSLILENSPTWGNASSSSSLWIPPISKSPMGDW